jgi:hypothetical protein
LFAQPLGIGVSDLAEQELGADGDYFNSHERRSSFPLGSTASQ